MINVAIGMGAIYVVWANGLLGDYASKALVYFSLLEEGIDEEITLEKAWFESSNKVAVVVRNIGVREANITTIYINGQAIKQYNTTQNLPYKLLVGRRVAFEVTYGWTSGSTYSFSVATSRGNQAKGDWVA
jgi:hypothetical protein